jgi:general stress protein 26
MRQEKSMKHVTCRLLLSLSLTLAPSIAQSQGAKPAFSRAELTSTAREIIITARYAALITRDSSGRAEARTVDPFLPDENFDIWIGTNPLTRKVAEIRRYPHVTLYYFDRESQAYVTIRGVARLVNDAAAKKKWFKDEWQAFYPDRVKGFTLIKVTPETMEVVNVKKGILGDSIKWHPPSIRLKRP